MAFRKLLVCLFPLLVGAAHAQDERSVVSPDGTLEFRLFTMMPEGSGINTLAYQVRLRGKPLLDTSYLGLNIHFQEPLLGENVGLSSAETMQGPGYNGLRADYLQTSSTGRRIEFEVRVWNDGVAFRYIVPKQHPLLDLLIEDDATQFHFADGIAGEFPAQAALPFVAQAPGAGWLGIFESRVAGFPPMSLVRTEAHTMISHVPDKPGDPGVAFTGEPPWTGPWRIVAIAPDRDHLSQSDVVRALKQ